MSVTIAAVATAIIGLGGGTTFGVLVRQPQVNKLQEQVRKLQEELKQMQLLVSNVQKDMEILRLKMQMDTQRDLLEAMQDQASEENCHLGTIIYAYGLKEYLELKLSYLLEHCDISEKEALFIDSFALSLDGKDTDKTIKTFLREYLVGKYNEEIQTLEMPDLDSILRKIEAQLETDNLSREEEIRKRVEHQEKLEKLKLDEEQTRLLYSLELARINYDIDNTPKDADRQKKTYWRNTWMHCIYDGLNANGTGSTGTYFIHSENTLYSSLINAYLDSKDKDWFYLLTMELMMFQLYTPIGASKEENEKWKGMKASSDYLKEVFIKRHDIVDQEMLSEFRTTYNRYVRSLSGTNLKVASGVAVAAAATVATAGLATAFAPGIAVMLAGGHVAGLSGAALTNASLAFVGGGAIAAGGMGVAGGTAIITGGGALLGLVGGSVSGMTATILMSMDGFALHESAKLLTYVETIILKKRRDVKAAESIEATLDDQIKAFEMQIENTKDDVLSTKEQLKYIEKNLSCMKKCSKIMKSLLDKYISKQNKQKGRKH